MIRNRVNHTGDNNDKYKDNNGIYYLVDSVNKVIIAKGVVDLNDTNNITVTYNSEEELIVVKNHVFHL